MPNLRPHRRWLIWAGVLAAALLFGGGATLMVQDRQQLWAVATALTGGDAGRAAVRLRRYGCVGCHTIPGVAGADGKVGGSLADLRRRVYIGGSLPNTPDHLIRWIVSPPSISPRTAMPETGIGEAEARDVAAYLYAQ